MSGALKTSYTLLAPFYDLVARPAFASARRQSLRALPDSGHCDVLIDGAGTGLDLPLLPRAHRYTALDLTRAMLARAAPRAAGLDIAWVQGDSLALPFAPARFDFVVLHLILAIVPDTAKALAEVARVLRPGGRALVLDKFLKRGERAVLRRLLSPLVARIVTRTDVILEDALGANPQLAVLSDEPALARGWIRRIVLERS